MDFENQELAKASSEEPQTVDLNRATEEQLASIPGIGPVLAQRIVDYRQAKGAFLAPEEITAVPGIGPSSYERLAPWLTVGPPETLWEEAALSKVQPVETELSAAEIPEEELAEEPAPEPAAAEAEAAPRPAEKAAVRREEARGNGFSWLWGALLGALLGVIVTLLILSTVNGSISLSQAPVVLKLNDRVETLATDTGEMRREVAQLEQRLKVLEGLPSRMDAVEETVAELGGNVSALEREVTALNNRLDNLEKDVAEVQAHAEQVQTFFQRLQSLLFEVFGMELPQASSSE